MVCINNKNRMKAIDKNETFPWHHYIHFVSKMGILQQICFNWVIASNIRLNWPDSHFLNSIKFRAQHHKHGISNSLQLIFISLEASMKTSTLLSFYYKKKNPHINEVSSKT